MSQRSKYCLIGIPDHQGVIHVGGRIGQAQGPQALRRALSRMKGRFPIEERLKDRGDAPGLGFDVSENHRLAADFVRDAHRSEAGVVSVVVGGGHDHGYSQLLGVYDALKRARGKSLRLGCINIDPHFDVRKPEPVPTSGSPFYLAMESGILDPSRFVEFGIQSHCNASALWEYIAKKKKVEVVPFEKLRHGKAIPAFQQSLKKLAARCDAIVVSLDIDAAAEAFAPGVSAPAAEGFTSSEVIHMAEIAGRASRGSRESKVVSLGIFELNPLHDIADRTARLCAAAAWHFVEAGIGVK